MRFLLAILLLSALLASASASHVCNSGWDKFFQAKQGRHSFGDSNGERVGRGWRAAAVLPAGAAWCGTGCVCGTIPGLILCPPRTSPRPAANDMWSKAVPAAVEQQGCTLLRSWKVAACFNPQWGQEAHTIQGEWGFDGQALVRCPGRKAAQLWSFTATGHMPRKGGWALESELAGGAQGGCYAPVGGWRSMGGWSSRVLCLAAGRPWAAAAAAAMAECQRAGPAASPALQRLPSLPVGCSGLSSVRPLVSSHSCRLRPHSHPQLEALSSGLLPCSAAQPPSSKDCHPQQLLCKDGLLQHMCTTALWCQRQSGLQRLPPVCCTASHLYCHNPAHHPKMHCPPVIPTPHQLCRFVRFQPAIAST